MEKNKEFFKALRENLKETFPGINIKSGKVIFNMEFVPECRNSENGKCIIPSEILIKYKNTMIAGLKSRLKTCICNLLDNYDNIVDVSSIGITYIRKDTGYYHSFVLRSYNDMLSAIGKIEREEFTSLTKSEIKQIFKGLHLIDLSYKDLDLILPSLENLLYVCNQPE